MTACPGLQTRVQTCKSERWDGDRTYQAGRANRRDRLRVRPKWSAGWPGEARVGTLCFNVRNVGWSSSKM
ncbi:BZ3500_MvSof-1268-A1-R1_Chr6-3g09031 [Microbotryum saponariae]|uniref:BZ3500_MvSof-1268-A1-R1_Chr6-3g09031 protein n=1 Tax=Microbotryum saponariae TaxID=289078 RepID=A0A2X0M6E2_9BASI|nr:BZ3500_MvSof-1268-A1-R1_Chr6-3g09031 [Microbotryum saponariae]SDA07633.1 BZ3501_MvSof-1269-A2-R1_Chr6-2g08735 [Microbotryum saponariae]